VEDQIKTDPKTPSVVVLRNPSIHNLLEISLSPSIPSSLRIIPTKYYIIVHLWTYASYKLLESLHCADLASLPALECLQGENFARLLSAGLIRMDTMADILYYPQKAIATMLLIRFPFFSPLDSSLLLRFLNLISVMLSLISTIEFEEPGVIAMLIFTSCFS
jgi:hypothetical protein